MSEHLDKPAPPRATECSGCTLKVTDGIPATWCWTPEGRLYCYECAKTRRLIR